MSKIKRSPIPWLTILITIISIGMFGVFHYFAANDTPTIVLYNKFGAPSTLEIYRGQYWGVIWNSFLHTRIELLGLNILGIWIFAHYIERRLKFIHLIFLVLFASFITTIIQFTLTDNAGIGFSGINYFLFAFILGRSIFDLEFRLKFRYLILVVLCGMLGWCYYQNHNSGWNIGVESMWAGLFIGFIIGLTTSFNRKIWSSILYITIVTGLSYTLVYAPWSAEWNVYKAFELHSKYDLQNAKKHYKKALEIDPKNQMAKENLFIIKIDELSDLAYKIHKNKNYIEARTYYDEILKLDPNNTWAKEQIKKLP